MFHSTPFPIVNGRLFNDNSYNFRSYEPEVERIILPWSVKYEIPRAKKSPRARRAARVQNLDKPVISQHALPRG